VNIEKQPFYQLNFDQYSVLELHRDNDYSFDLGWIQSQEEKLKKIQGSQYTIQYLSLRVLEENEELKRQVEYLKKRANDAKGDLKKIFENIVRVGEPRIHFIVKEFLVVRKQDIKNIQKLINYLGFDSTLLTEEEAASIRIK
jgi:chromosome segregation ATPase